MDVVCGKVVRTEKGDSGTEIIVDVGYGDLLTAEIYLPPGVDAKPIPGDEVLAHEIEGSRYVASGFDMPADSTVKDGELKFVARKASDGSIVASFYMTENGDVIINGLTIDKDGNLKTPGEVTAKDVNLSTHIHAHPMGPTQPPTPNT